MKWIKRIGVIVLGIALAVLYCYGTWEYPIYDENVDSSTYANVGELLEGAVVEQTFVCEHDGLQEIDLTVSNLGYEPEAEYYWSLTETDTDELVAEGTFLAEDISNSEDSVFEFDRIADSGGKEYTFVIETESISSEHGITLMMTEASSDYTGELTVDGDEMDSVLVLSAHTRYLNVETGIVFLGIYIYLVAFMTFLTRLFK